MPVPARQRRLYEHADGRGLAASGGQERGALARPRPHPPSHAGGAPGRAWGAVSIEVEGLGKRYWLRGSAPGTFQETLGLLVTAARRRRPFWALRDVSFRVVPGEAVGLVGS